MARPRLVRLGLLVVQVGRLLLVVLAVPLVLVGLVQHRRPTFLVVQHLLGHLVLLVDLEVRVDRLGMVCMVVVSSVHMVAAVVCQAYRACQGLLVCRAFQVCRMVRVVLVGLAGSIRCTVCLWRDS
jgi:formate hydrogenlyase subunit 3/multisubunit Na+/H+ antiporter MnhD subunit